VTLGHSHITSYREFTERLMDRFDRRDPEIHFRDLAQLRQTGTPEAFITEFQRVVVVMIDISEPRLIMLFTEGLTEPLRGWVNAYRPHTLQDAILRTRDLADLVSKTKTFSKPFVIVPQNDRDRKPFQREWKGKEKLDDDTRRELMRKKLCFTCKDPWVPGHKCTGRGKIHYIEVAADSDEEEQGNQAQDSESTSSEEEPSHAEEQPPHRLPTPIGAQSMVELQPHEKAKRRAPTKGGVIVTLSGVPRYDTLKIRGSIQG
jgi:hypothetical protein